MLLKAFFTLVGGLDLEYLNTDILDGIDSSQNSNSNPNVLFFKHPNQTDYNNLSDDPIGNHEFDPIQNNGDDGDDGDDSDDDDSDDENLSPEEREWNSLRRDIRRAVDGYDQANPDGSDFNPDIHAWPVEPEDCDKINANSSNRAESLEELREAMEDYNEAVGPVNVHYDDGADEGNPFNQEHAREYLEEQREIVQALRDKCQEVDQNKDWKDNDNESSEENPDNNSEDDDFQEDSDDNHPEGS